MNNWQIVDEPVVPNCGGNLTKPTDSGCGHVVTELNAEVDLSEGSERTGSKFVGTDNAVSEGMYWM